MKLTCVSILVFVSMLLSIRQLDAQCNLCCTEYRMIFQTVYDQQPMTSYRLVYETQFEERKIVTQRPVWETQQRERRYRVAKPVQETNMRERRYKMMRPVVETFEQQRQYTVRRPTVETIMQDRNRTTYEQVTFMETQTVDQGQFVNQQTHIPGRVRRRLRFQRRQYYTDPLTGMQRWQRAGLYWVPMQGPGTVQVNRTWVPNPVTVQVPRTTVQPKQVVEQVPVQVTTFKDEIVTENVPVQVCSWKEEEVVQQIPVTRIRYEYEERVEPITVHVCKMISEEKTVLVRKCVPKWVPVTTMCMRPRTIVMRIPLESSVQADAAGTKTYRPEFTGSHLQSTESESPPLAPTKEEDDPSPLERNGSSSNETGDRATDVPVLPEITDFDELKSDNT